ncbi:MAG: glycosyltransferase [Planctomycetes bacterium]|nr:glycosyltransferase [Planctomycetota bacterium]
MGKRTVLHILESLRPEAGSLAVILPGLLGSLEGEGFGSMFTAWEPGRTPPDESRPVMPAPAALRAEDVLGRIATSDIIHFHGWNGSACRALAAAARAARRPCVITPLGALAAGPYHPRGWRDKLRGVLWESALIRGAAAIAANNQAEAAAMQRSVSGARVTTLGYGVLVQEYAGARTTDAGGSRRAGADRRLLVLGPVHPVEGLVPLLKAFAELGRDADGWSITIAGPAEGGWRSMIEAAVRRKGAADRVRFAPAADAAAQRALLAEADALACVGLHFRAPVSIMQALASGVPVLATDCVAPDGLNDVTGACPPQREAIRERLRELLRLDDEARARLGRAGREAALARWDWSVVGPRYAQLYRSIV